MGLDQIFQVEGNVRRHLGSGVSKLIDEHRHQSPFLLRLCREQVEGCADGLGLEKGHRRVGSFAQDVDKSCKGRLQEVLKKGDDTELGELYLAEALRRYGVHLCHRLELSIGQQISNEQVLQRIQRHHGVTPCSLSSHCQQGLDVPCGEHWAHLDEHGERSHFISRRTLRANLAKPALLRVLHHGRLVHFPHLSMPLSALLLELLRPHALANRAISRALAVLFLADEPPLGLRERAEGLDKCLCHI
mmetsp:Transcript_113809/g.284683  ORF Transcript_113809/g.284683 Transcript_113809/m.284683 type:complete len:246 (+) Transcript_113809:1835-2572(+)